jgi:hypothetical protein
VEGESGLAQYMSDAWNAVDWASYILLSTAAIVHFVDVLDGPDSQRYVAHKLRLAKAAVCGLDTCDGMILWNHSRAPP